MNTFLEYFIKSKLADAGHFEKNELVGVMFLLFHFGNNNLRV